MSNSPLPFLQHERPKGFVFVVSAPAGTGKTTLVNMLCDEFPRVKRSVSCTTRGPRPGEHHGVDYYFLNDEEFLHKEKEDEFIETATVFNHRYGTSKALIEQELSLGHHVVLVIDTQGAMQIKAKMKATFIFILPPSIKELHSRLEMRGTETEEALNMRLQWAEKEMLVAPMYDYLIVNSNLSLAYEVLRSILIAHEHRVEASINY